jgi:maltooligosyltrehalose trehalohydrolase
MTGAHCRDDGTCEFTLWAPLAESISLKIRAPFEKVIPMQKSERGYWKTTVDGIPPGTLYMYGIEGELDRPDPASYFQPKGVHEASQIIDHGAFPWSDSEWQGLPLPEMIMYELHVGTFTPDGTFEAVIPRLEELKDLGINALEIMPIAQFPGERNWGYDGVYPYAVQNSYGGPEGLKGLVNACHKKGMAVILDVVYNHLGPEGNYLGDYGPYFTDRYKTPWGQAINFDGPYSNEVRKYFIDNALYWFEHYHVDALRLDAVHGIYDMSARHFLLELSESVGEFSKLSGRKYYLIAESDLNNPLLAAPEERGGCGMDGLWCDDFHHSLHTLLTGEDTGYYVDFEKTDHLVKSLKEGYVYSGQFSRFRKKNHGNSSRALPADRFIVFSQNHDQAGNRMLGERLSSLVSFESLKLAAGIVLLSPYIPLIFMGEEYGERAPFLYFISHSDAQLIERIREGRKKDFEMFAGETAPSDPQNTETFVRSKIDWHRRTQGHHMALLHLYKELIQCRRDMKALAYLDKNCCEVLSDRKGVIGMRRWKDDAHVTAIFNFNKSDKALHALPRDMVWKKVVDSSDSRWHGPGALLPDRLIPHDELIIRAESFALYAAKD